MGVLGSKVCGWKNPAEAELDLIKNEHSGMLFVSRFTCPEFTSLCPVTDQPDFARLIIDYAPREFLVESKSLKLYLGSFRNHGSFHEDCTMTIASRLCHKLQPVWIRVCAFWYPRGGIPIDVFWEKGDRPNCAPPFPIADYHGR